MNSFHIRSTKLIIRSQAPPSLGENSEGSKT